VSAKPFHRGARTALEDRAALDDRAMCVKGAEADLNNDVTDGGADGGRTAELTDDPMLKTLGRRFATLAAGPPARTVAAAAPANGAVDGRCTCGISAG